MAALIPVDHDPFAAAAPNLVPVDHDPFAPNYGDDVEKSLGAGVGKAASNLSAEFLTHPVTALANTIARPIVQGATRLAGAAYEGMGGELSPDAARTLTYPMGGDPESPQEKMKQALATQAIPSVVKEATGMDINYQPQTKLGEYAASVGSAVPYVALGMPPSTAVGVGLGSQAGKDVASLITDNPKYQEAAGVVGGGAGALVAPTVSAGMTDLLKDESTSALGKLGLPSGTTSANEPVDVSVSQMKELGTQAYDSAEAKGGVMGQASSDKAIDDAISKGGNQLVKGQLPPGANHVIEAQDYLKAMKGSPTSLADLDKLDDFLRDKIGQAFRGGLNKQGADLLKMRDALRTASKNASAPDIQNPDAFADWQKGDKIWTAYRAAKDIQDGIENAQNADVPSTAIKNYFKNFVKNEDNLASLTDDEIAAAKHAAKYGIVTRALKTVGNRFASTIAGAVAGGAAGIAGGGPVGAALGAPMGIAAGAAVTEPIGALANARQAARGQAVIDTIAQRPEIQEAARAARGLPPAAPPTSPPSLASMFGINPNALNTIAPAAIIGSVASNISPNAKPATGSIGDQNIKELQKLKFAPQSNNQVTQPSIQQSQMNIKPNAGDFFAKEAKAESANNPNAKNPNSSASGQFQFTDGTWKQMVKRHGDDTGITLADKNDPKAQEVMARLYAKDNLNRMQPFLGRLPTKGELYLAHVLGADGALRLINAANNQPNKQALMLFPKAVTMVNQPLFFNGHQPRTALDVYQTLAKKVA